ncbi:MAG: bifunctional ADP-dependent NAD(P)H-hydrate dehydratase/NAD(P)H-hydrate epimerase [Sulfurimonas sp.]|nr:MAG: bifunctional ADP-dependent NAD(P)H-hydrate dehydratase/NAD(P)H-hydrate epimerase [Sulfurimonas sp.]
MQNLFDEVGFLDKRSYSEFGLTEDLLMEHAANGMALYIKENFTQGAKLTIVCGSGNNGADGLALARLLHLHFNITLFLTRPPTSAMSKLQYQRIQNLNIKESEILEKSDILVDALIGTGFKGELSPTLIDLLQGMNKMSAFKIACDIPSGFVFNADVTLTMGALKKSLFCDKVKDIVGEIRVLDLGIHRDLYEIESTCKLLDEDDLELPYRTQQNSHKGSFGHLSIAHGEMRGASTMSALAATRFGCGLVTLITHDHNNAFHYSLMSSAQLPKNTTALCCGMGLGNAFSNDDLETFFDNEYPLILDADIFYLPIILTLLKRESLVLSPHPKEFISLLKLTNLANISIEELQKNRFTYVELFVTKYNNVTLLLKGANVIIAKEKEIFVNPHGTSALAKGGSGDVLSGLIGSLLAQGYSPLNAAVHASLAHTKLAKNYTGTDFSLTPDDLIEEIGNL